MQDLGKLIILVGLIVVVFGIFILFSSKIPYFGKLPGDIFIKKENFIFYAPITTSIIISIILTIILSIIFNLKR